MKILFVDQSGELGGAQQCLLELIPAVLAKKLLPLAAVPAEGPLASRLEALGVPVSPITPGRYASGRKGVRDLLRYGVRLPALAWQLRAICAAHSVDLLYVNGPRVLPAAVFCRDVPVLFHAHNYLPPGPSRRLVRWALGHRGVAAIAVSSYVAGYLGDSAKAIVVPNGARDLRRTRTTGGAPSIGLIGRIAPEKGHLAFLAAAARVARRLPQARFVICGSAAAEEQRDFEKTVRQQAKGLPVDFLGWRDDVGEVLASLDLLVVPSAPQEAFCRTVIEGFSALTPVVAFASGGICELVEDGRNGFLVNPPTAEALADRIVEAITDQPARTRIAANARADWERHFTLNQYTGRMMQAIQSAAKEGANSFLGKTSIPPT